MLRIFILLWHDLSGTFVGSDNQTFSLFKILILVVHFQLLKPKSLLLKCDWVHEILSYQKEQYLDLFWMLFPDAVVNLLVSVLTSFCVYLKNRVRKKTRSWIDVSQCTLWLCVRSCSVIICTRLKVSLVKLTFIRNEIIVNFAARLKVSLAVLIFIHYNVILGFIYHACPETFSAHAQSLKCVWLSLCSSIMKLLKFCFILHVSKCFSAYATKLRVSLVKSLFIYNKVIVSFLLPFIYWNAFLHNYATQLSIKL